MTNYRLTPKANVFLGFRGVDDEHEGTEEEGGEHGDHGPPELEVGTQLRHHFESLTNN